MTERSSDILFPEIFHQLPVDQKKLIRKYLPIMRKVDLLFEIQEKLGFYPEDVKNEEIMEAAKNDPKILSHYTLVRRREGQLRGLNYRNFSQSREIMDEISDDMASVIRSAYKEQLPQRHLISAHLLPQIDAFDHGNFESARFQQLNSLRYPEVELVTGLFDRYLDDRLNLKFAWQGWIIAKNNAETDYFNQVINTALATVDHQGEHRAVAGPAIDFAGLARRRKWRGNTLPSEDELRTDIGTRSYIFTNTMKEKVFELEENVRERIPEMSNIHGWIGQLEKAVSVNLALHEGYGHTLAVKGAPVSLKELSAEVLSHSACLRLSEKLVPPSLKRLCLATSLVWFWSDVESYLEETNPVKKQIVRAYAEAGAMMLNMYESAGCIKVSDGKIVRMAGLDKFRQVSHKVVEDIEDAVSSNSAWDFIDVWINTPRRYLATLDTNPDSNPSHISDQLLAPVLVG